MINLLAAVESQIMWYIGAGVIVVILAIVTAVIPIKLWLRCLISGAHVSVSRLVGMKLRNINMSMVVESYIKAKKAGIQVTISELETHYLAGGNVDKVVLGLISANSGKISLSIEQAKAIDLAGRDVYKAVKESVIPQVIETPMISAVAQNGVELKVIARVTIKTNLNRLVGGAGEETILSRVGEGIVSTVGGAKTHKDVLQNPDKISSEVQEKGLDDGTAFHILSVDIADIDVGRNIGADLQAEQAEADKIVAQAKAEERTAEARAAEQEMRAVSERMRSKVLEAEADVPKALANAFNDGKIGVMEYYKMQNLISDTQMREAFGGKTNNKQSPKKLAGPTETKPSNRGGKK